MKSVILKKSRSRHYVAFGGMIFFLVLSAGVAFEPQFRNPPNLFAFLVAAVSSLLCLACIFYLIIYVISDSLTEYEIFPDKVVVRKIAFGNDKAKTIYYADVKKIRVRMPLLGNIPKNYYANFQLLTAAATIDLEAVSEVDEVLSHLFLQVSRKTDVPIELLYADDLTRLICLQALKRGDAKSVADKQDDNEGQAN